MKRTLYTGILLGVLAFSLSAITAHAQFNDIHVASGIINAAVFQASAAEPSSELHQDPSDGATGITVGISRVFEPTTGVDLNLALSEFNAEITYDSTCVNVVEVRSLDFTTTSKIDNPTGITIIGGDAMGGALPPTEMSHVLTRLFGSNKTPCAITIEIPVLIDVGGNPVPVTNSVVQRFLRGDAETDGVIDIADALSIAQYLIGLRDACTNVVDTNCLHSVNAASVRADGAFDEKTIADALFIAQYLVGLRDENYNPTP